MRKLLPLLLLAGCVDVSMNETPPDSVEVVGDPGVGTFHVWTTLDSAAGSTLVTMSLTPPGTCESATLDQAVVTAGDVTTALDGDGNAVYNGHLEGTALAYELEARRGDDALRVTVTPPLPYALSFDRAGTLRWTVDPSPDDVKVDVIVTGPVSFRGTFADTGELRVPMTAHGTYHAQIEKRRETPWWCQPLADGSNCCGFWDARVERSADVTMP